MEGENNLPADRCPRPLTADHCHGTTPPGFGLTRGYVQRPLRDWAARTRAVERRGQWAVGSGQPLLAHLFAQAPQHLLRNISQGLGYAFVGGSDRFVDRLIPNPQLL